MTTLGDLTSDSGLLAAAALVLRSRGFVVHTTHLSNSSVPLLLAEDAHFVLCVIEFESADQLTALESAGTFELTEHLEGALAKRWDAYLVLLSRDLAPTNAFTSTVSDILYNTRYVRRLVRWGVSNTEESVTRALRPFVGLPNQDPGHALDPVQLLLDRLPLYGIDKTTAVEAISMWQASGDLVDEDE
jgi:hypothetical protein